MNTGLEGKSLWRGSAWMVTGFAARMGLQALYFVLVARVLGPTGYGAFAGVVAIMSILSPFSGVGAGNLLVKHTARDSAAFAERWKATLVRTGMSGSLLVGVLWTAVVVLRPPNISPTIVVVVGFADVVLARLLDMCGHAYQALGRMNRMAQLQALPAVTRLLAASLLVWRQASATAEMWSWLYLLGAFAATAFAVLRVGREIGTGFFRAHYVFSELGEGIHFSIGQAAQGAYNDIDKAMLAPMVGASVVGIYAAAYRIIDVSFAPVRAVLFTTYARFFRAGREGLSGSRALATKLLPFFALYGAVAAAGLAVCAPLLPLLLGNRFSGSVAVLIWLSVLVLLKPVHYLAADTLTGSGHQGVRSACQVCVALLNVGLNLVLIPQYSWRGAAWASIACDATLVVILWTATVWIDMRSRALNGGQVTLVGTDLS